MVLPIQFIARNCRITAAVCFSLFILPHTAVAVKVLDISISGTTSATQTVTGRIGFATCENLIGCGTYTGASPGAPEGICDCLESVTYPTSASASTIASLMAGVINADQGCQSEGVSAVANGSTLTVTMPEDRFCYLTRGEMLNCGGPGNSSLQLEECTIPNVLNDTHCDENQPATGGLTFSKPAPIAPIIPTLSPAGALALAVGFGALVAWKARRSRR